MLLLRFVTRGSYKLSGVNGVPCAASVTYKSWLRAIGTSLYSTGGTILTLASFK